MANSPSQHTLPKGLFMFSIGTAIFATLMYKVTATATSASTASTATTSTATSTASTATTATTWSNFLSRFFNHYIAAEEQASKDADIPFEDKYFKEYDEWVAAQDAAEAAATDTDTDTAAQAHKKECLENMLYVRETINDFYGDIIMRYDAAIFSFVYYARTANIPYKYLETVSRKYMIETNAPRDIHIDIRKEYTKAKEHLTNKKVSFNVPQAAAQAADNDNDTKQETDVFAKFKTYNTAPNISNTNQNSTKTTTTTEPTNNTSTKVMRENANRYSYRGKIDEWATTGPAVAPVTNATTTPADATTTAQANETYAEYKKRIVGGFRPPTAVTTFYRPVHSVLRRSVRQLTSATTNLAASPL